MSAGDSHFFFSTLLFSSLIFSFSLFFSAILLFFIMPILGVDILKGKSTHSQVFFAHRDLLFPIVAIDAIVTIDTIVTIDFIGVFLFRKRFGQLVLLGFMSPLYTCSLSTS